MAVVSTDFDKILEANAVRLYRLIASFKNEYGYNTVQSSVRATIMVLMELMEDRDNMSIVEMKMLISKITEIELSKRHFPMPRLVKDAKDNKFYDLRNSPLIARLTDSKTDLQLLELPFNTLTILIVPIANDVRLRVVAFTDDVKVPFVEVGDLHEKVQ